MVKQIINNSIGNCYDRYLIKARRNHEIKKFMDPRRKAIYETVELTDEQKKLIDHLYESYYGEKIPYTWHRHFTAFTGKFDPAYFPELLYIPEFEYLMNPDRNYAAVYEDKNVLPMIAAGVGVHMPRTVFFCANGLLRDGEYRITDIETMRKQLPSEIYFAKPSVDTCSGKGCMLTDPQSDTFLKDISSLGPDYIVQERIVCSPSVEALHPESVNTFRIMTYLWKDNIEIVPAVMRIGRGTSFLDNAHAGGMFIGVNEDGTLHDRAFTEFKEEFTEHPDTHVKFKGYKIQHFDKVIGAAIKMHSAMPQLGIVNWDITIGQDEEAVLVEANTSGGGIWVFQMAWGCGPFGENTEEILSWIRKQKSTPKSKRYA